MNLPVGDTHVPRSLSLDRTMHLPALSDSHLTYCLNIHPGETWAQNLAAIREHAQAVKARVAPTQPFGLGLRVSRRAIDDLADPARVQELRALLAAGGMYAFTINGFPYGTFHGQPVKAEVYRPDWRQPERLDYTCRLGAFLAAVLPDGASGSISTVPVSYRPWIRSPHDLDAAIENLAACAAEFDALRQQTGREVHLGLEPEPDCLLETTPETIAFFEQRLRPGGVAWLKQARGFSTAAAESVLARHIGVCFDTCHASVQFETLDASVTALSRAGIRLSKVQISAALRAPMNTASARRLEAFVDPAYLHQAKFRAPGGPILASPDLTRAFLAGWGADDPSRECRVHFHVPLYVAEYDGIASTADELTPTFWRAAIAAGCRHFEIETYTFNVLPAALRRATVEQSIADEYAWVRARMAE